MNEIIGKALIETLEMVFISTTIFSYFRIYTCNYINSYS